MATAGASPGRGQERRQVIGYLSGFTEASALPGALPAFRQGPNETGFVEGRNVSIEFRWAVGITIAYHPLRTHGRADAARCRGH